MCIGTTGNINDADISSKVDTKVKQLKMTSIFLTVIRYIHQNPIKAGLAKGISDYKWSSYSDYINENGITDIDYAMNILNSDKEKAIETFKTFHENNSNDSCLEIEDSRRLRDEEALELIKKTYKINSGTELQNLGDEKRDQIIRGLRKSGLSTRQLERLTGISRAIILKA